MPALLWTHSTLVSAEHEHRSRRVEVISAAARSRHASDSAEQRVVENEISEKLRKKLRVRWTTQPKRLGKLQFDAFAKAEPKGRPVLVEIFAHVGARKPGQAKRISHDMAKLLLAQRLMRRKCTMIIALAASGENKHEMRGWQALFAEEFGINTLFVEIDPTDAARVIDVQRRQRDGMAAPELPTRWR